MSMNPPSPYLGCLVIIQSFETMWAYYSQSNGELYDFECRTTAISMLENINSLAQINDKLRLQLATTRVNDVQYQEIIEKLAGWARSDRLVPFTTFGDSRRSLFGFLSGMKLFLHVELQIPFTPTITMSSKEIEHGQRVMRWKGYLPEKYLRLSRSDPDKLIEQAGHSKTIVVVADIRRSHKLLQQINDIEEFTRFMARFMEKSRELIKKHNGFFDKFTGDGFIAYFNEKICHELGGYYVDCFFNFLGQELDTVKGLFYEWSETLPGKVDGPIGLSIGCDLGEVYFRDVDNHLISIGESVVWAHRMSGIGEVGEIIIHQPLSDVIAHLDNVALEPRHGTTKHGMQYTAHTLELKN